ncbi:hypothetical protein evm_014533 [Chilo suppressalis]|nr:hypothetical protein evm_014533 [Chilo suppressalis]
MRHQRFCTDFSKKFAAFRKYMVMLHAPAASIEITYNNRCRRAEITTLDTNLIAATGLSNSLIGNCKSCKTKTKTKTGSARPRPDLKSNTILHLQVSDSTSSGTVYLVVVDTQGAIAVWTKGNRKFEHYVTLPTYKCTPSALTVDCAHESLVVVYVDQKITEYDLVKKKFLEWPNNALAQEWAERRSAVSSVCAHPTRDALVFSDDTSLWVMERRQGQPEEPVAKKKVKEEQTLD